MVVSYLVGHMRKAVLKATFEGVISLTSTVLNRSSIQRKLAS
jgi:hypothetical protein